MSQTLKILKEARDLISAPERWTQGTYARDGSGEPCPESAEQAVSFCAVGACHRVAPGFADASKAVAALYYVLPSGRPSEFNDTHSHGGPSEFNDTHSHAEVLDVFAQAIAKVGELR